MWALFRNLFLPASIDLANLQIAHEAPRPGMVWVKSSHFDQGAIGCDPSKPMNPILSNFAPSHPIVLRRVLNSNTCLLSSLHTSAPKIERAQLAALSIFEIMILGCDRDVNAGTEVGLDVVV